MSTTRATLAALLDVIGEINRSLPVVMPLHPRTRGNIEKFGFTAKLDGLHILPPVGYLDMLGLMRDAKLVLTDSGGIQEETTALGVPCLTLRDNTERPITLIEGTNTLVGADPAAIRAAFNEVMTHGGKAGRIPEYWDGRAAMRIAHTLKGWLPQQKGSEGCVNGGASKMPCRSTSRTISRCRPLPRISAARTGTACRAGSSATST